MGELIEEEEKVEPNGDPVNGLVITEEDKTESDEDCVDDIADEDHQVRKEEVLPLFFDDLLPIRQDKVV